MTQLLLAILDRAETADLVLEAAAAAAARLGGGEIAALVIRHSAMEGIMPTEEVAGPARLAERGSEETARIAAIRACFDAWVARGHAGHWQEQTGETATVLARAAKPGDVLVIGHAPGAERDATQAMDIALFSAHLPSLFVPAGSSGSLGRHIAIAWKPSAVAKHALASAMPLLLKAERVTVLMADEGAGSGVDADLEPLLAPIQAAGIALDRVAITLGGRTVGQALLQETHKVGADLLVMGAYTHARWTECLLGGATREILHKADLPVLMQH